MQELQSRLDENTLNLIKTLVENARVFGVKIYFVGGLVRDLLLNLPIKDVDIVVEGNAINFVKSLKNVEIKSLHEDFGTAKTIIQGQEIDFASTREEDYPFSGCLPVVKNIGCTLKRDVLRRDFTLNAIALDLEDFSFVDYQGGIEDLKNKTLKILHDKSFIDDPTRILRGLDFKQRFGFHYDDNTKKQMEKYLKAPDREHLSFSRVDLTLRKIFSHPKPECSYEEILRENLYKIFTDNPPPQGVQEAIKEFSATNNVYFMALRSETPQRCEKSDTLGVYHFFKNFTQDELAHYYLWHKDLEVLEYKNKYRYVRINTKGEDLLRLGYKEGVLIGRILNALLEKNLKKQMGPEEELSWVVENFATQK